MCEHKEDWSHQVNLMINGKHECIDRCIAPLVIALNDCGMRTIASCCGHGYRPGNVILADGREIFIIPDFETGRQVDEMFPVDIQGVVRR